MDMKLTGVTIKGVVAKLNGFKNAQPFINNISQKLLNQFRLGFKQSKAPDGSPWAKITHRTGQPLRDTGRLQRSLTAKVQGSKITIGTNVDYAARMQFGGQGKLLSVKAHTAIKTQAFGKPLKFPVYANVKAHTKKDNVKARPFIGFSKRQRDLVNKAFTQWTDGKIS
jgi:phage gpG-like protein